MTTTNSNDPEEVFRIALRTRVYHADLLEAARKCGGIRALAARLQLSSSTVAGWVLLRKFPSLMCMGPHGRERPNTTLVKKWPHIVKELYALTGKTVAQLFPNFVRLSGVLEAPKTSEMTREFTAGDMLAFRGRPVEALPAPVDPMEHTLARDKIEEALKVLTAREREILKLRFGLHGGEPSTFEEIGRVFKITRNRVAQIEAKALRKLRHGFRLDLLRPTFEALTDANPCPRCNDLCTSFVRCKLCDGVYCRACVRPGVHKCRKRP